MANRDPPTSVAAYPVRVEHLRFGAHSVRLLVVDKLELFLDRDALLRDADAAEPPYWAHLWTGSRALARQIAQRDDWRGKRVVDIGCGLGLLSVIAALQGAEVTAIDTATEAVSMTRANAELNGCGVSALQADLRQGVAEALFDHCLAADVSYDRGLQEALAAFLDRHLASGGIGWCAESVRTRDTAFREACEARRLRVSEIELSEIEDRRPVAVRIARITRDSG
jgi:SAM-dependent methyltransferase